MPRRGYKVITITQEVYNKIALLMEKLNQEAGFNRFRSIAHFVEDSIMKYYEKDLIPLEHFNIGETGVKILDRKIGDRGKIIDVYFKPDQAYCGHCEKAKCPHIDFALSLPQVQAIIRKKGWKIPEV